MGKPLINQRRGKGSSTFRRPDHRFLAPIFYPHFIYSPAGIVGQVTAILDDIARSTPVVEVALEDGRRFLSLACEGIAIGDKLPIGKAERPALGAILPLGAIPDGTPVFDVEFSPRDGGKIARTSGTSALVIAHEEETGAVMMQLSSKKTVSLSPNCFATVGVAAGGGRLEKPLLKAGNASKAARARGRYYPIVRGTAMSAYDHPHGGRSFGKSTTIARTSPPGQKVGLLAARTSGRRKGRKSQGSEGTGG
ncbi:50S ribosomal protein L2 [Candidatus Micrarchaeota archaeon]|nr:50S ribosomal protein L2 [Candidatus Micrarchaeota archaeon]MBI5177197.1 50S ribosomal protein L2 [Candidatus Micrarchaeota archaeon]